MFSFCPWHWASSHLGANCKLRELPRLLAPFGAVVSDVVSGKNESPRNLFPGKETIAFRPGSLNATTTALKKSANLMNGPAIQMRLAKQLFAACPDVVEVRFNMTATDWDSSIFRGEEGSAIKGICGDPSRGNDWPLWGFNPCL